MASKTRKPAPIPSRKESPIQKKNTSSAKSLPSARNNLEEQKNRNAITASLENILYQRKTTDKEGITKPFTPIQKKENKTGLPENLKSGIENLSGFSMDDVKVHYNSDKPAQLSSHAYAQGTDIHVAPGQERHLPHEAWHVVQQKQGRVKPTMQMKEIPINDDAGLEKEADIMGNKGFTSGFNLSNTDGSLKNKGISTPVSQRVIILEGEKYSDKYDQRRLISMIQSELKFYGYNVTTKLLVAVANGIKDEGVLAGGEFESFDDFVDFVTQPDLNLTSEKISARSGKHRPKELGKRPGFIASIVKARNTIKEKALAKGEKKKFAARHIIPSHLLGYAAEHVEASDEELNEWVLKYSTDEITGEFKKANKVRRKIWIILHNNPKNLWIGDYIDNSAIGFSAGIIESLIEKLITAKDDMERLEILRDFDPGEGQSALGKRMTALKEAAKAAIEEIIGNQAALKSELTDDTDEQNPRDYVEEVNESFEEDFGLNLERKKEDIAAEIDSNVALLLDDIFTQIETDPFWANREGFEQAQELMLKLQEKPKLEDLTTFMETDFGSNIGPGEEKN